MPMLMSQVFSLLVAGFICWQIMRHLYRHLLPKWQELQEWIADGNSLITEVVSRGSYFFLFCLFVLLAL